MSTEILAVLTGATSKFATSSTERDGIEDFTASEAKWAYQYKHSNNIEMAAIELERTSTTSISVFLQTASSIGSGLETVRLQIIWQGHTIQCKSERGGGSARRSCGTK